MADEGSADGYEAAADSAEESVELGELSYASASEEEIEIPRSSQEVRTLGSSREFPSTLPAASQ